jgi:hypothetical protein
MKRIAFIGQGRYFKACSFEDSYDENFGKFFDLDFESTQNNLVIDLLNYEPTTIVFFRPDAFSLLTRTIKDHLKIKIIGVLTEPVSAPKFRRVDNIRDRRKRLKVEILKCEVDYWVCYTPDLAHFVGRYVDVSAVFPLPVNDNLFRVETSGQNILGKPIFLGRLNKHRNDLLHKVKHQYDPLIVENGLPIEVLSELYPDKTLVTLNLHVGSIRTFEHRALCHMAQGHLVVSELLTPDYGFLPDCEYLLIKSDLDLLQLLESIYNNIPLSKWIANRGHLMSKRHRASEVWPSLIDSIFIGSDLV